MTYVIIGAAALIVLLAGGLVIAVKVAQSKARKLAQTEAALESAQQEIKRQGDYGKKKQEAQKNADSKKESLRTGDNAVDFGNSLDVLHGAGKNRDK